MDSKTILETIASLEQRKEALWREIESIDVEVESHKRAYARIVNNDAPVFRLPNELLTEILIICQNSPTPRKKAYRCLPLQVTISHVSQRWREVVLETPLFWNTVDFRVRSMAHIQRCILPFLDARLTRSLSCFLDITLDFDIDIDGLQPFFDLLSRHCERWRRLSIISHYSCVDQIHSFLQKARTPILEHLSLSIVEIPREGSSPRQQYNDVFPSILPSASERLKFVRLAGLSLGNHHPPTSFVTTLHLDGWTRHYMTHKQFQHILQAAPSLINLSLNELCIHFPRDPIEILSPVNLPHLLNLRIRGSCSPIARPLALMSMPNLHSLSLLEIQAFDSDVIPSVRCLSLEACSIGEIGIEHLFRAFPSVTSLSIDNSVPFIFSMLRPEEEPQIQPEPWARLETMSLRQLEQLDVSRFCDMAFALDEIKRGLRSVFLDRRSREVLRRKHRLDWLRELVPKVENCDEQEPWPLGLGYEDTHDLLI